MAHREPSRWREAELSYTQAARHFAAAKEPGWEATILNNLAVLHKSQGEYAKAEVLFRRTLKITEDLYPRTKYPDGHREIAMSINNLAMLHQGQGEYAKAEPLLRRSLKMREALYPVASHPQGHPEIAIALNNLGLLHLHKGDFAQAEPLFRRSLQMREQSYPKTRFPQGHPDLSTSINNLAGLYKSQGDFGQAEPLYRRALAMAETLYPKQRFPQGHPDLANSINNLAMLHLATGEYTSAEPLFLRTLRMRQGLYPKAQYPQGHPNLAQSLNNLGLLYHYQAEPVQAEQHYRQALEMEESLFPKTRYPNGHPALALSYLNLASLHSDQGEYARAEKRYEHALRMYEALYPTTQYPQGHPDIARALNNVAMHYQAQREFAKATKFSRRTLDMYAELYPKNRYPDGHPDLARATSNLAILHQAQDDFNTAERLFRQALVMRETAYSKTRYPQGHPELAGNINNLAVLFKVQGEYIKAEPMFRRAIDMTETLFPRNRYPQRHPSLATLTANLAAMYNAQGEKAKAAERYREALAMSTESVVAIAASGNEATALNYLPTLPYARDGLLSVSFDLAAEKVYPGVWHSKAALTRVLEQRHLAALAIADPETRQLWHDILTFRQDRERLLLTPMEAVKATARDNRLDQIDEEIRRKEIVLARQFPELKRPLDMDRVTPANLRKALPPGIVLVDFVRYICFEYDPKIKGIKRQKQTNKYAAFVLTRDTVHQVDLAGAKVLEDMLALWRRAVMEGSPSEPDYAAKMHEMVWKPLVQHLPRNCSLVYLVPDAALHTLPWAALRDSSSGQRLIEIHAVAVVPHGPMLLDRLTQGKRKSEMQHTFLAMGGVEYDKVSGIRSDLALRTPPAESITWKELPATRKEVNQLVALAGERKVILRQGQDAAISTLLADLSKAQTAHLATHGFFADKKFRTVFQLDEVLFTKTEFVTGGTVQRIGAAARSPLVLSGLVCSGANLKETPSRGILTAEAIVGLDLRKMDLAVLSACETGLGDVAGGEGVFGLTRAFHIAGCRNVCASLWQVEDEATAALMVLFYRQLWGKEPVPPAEALRRAQVALMREPERLKEWAVGRGPLPRPIAAGGKTTEKATTIKASPARTWAGFVLSGPGD